MDKIPPQDKRLQHETGRLDNDEMKTARLEAHRAGICEAAELLRQGKTVAFPTETVYGLGADATSDEAVEGIYRAKGRPGNNPLIVHVPDTAEAQQWAAIWPREADMLARTFWPGPLTIILPAVDKISRRALAGGDTVGLRVPDHPIAQALLRKAGIPIAAPSANRSNGLSTTTAEDVWQDLAGRIAAILDSPGPGRVGLESTVVTLLDPDKPCVLRAGTISATRLEDVLCKPVKQQGGSAVEAGMLLSPGRLSSHYTPRVPLLLFTRENLPDFQPDDAVLWRGIPPDYASGGQCLPSQATAFGAALYRTLWEAQTAGAARIFLEEPPRDDGRWEAVWDRLNRAVSRTND